ncbi:hypothetical protein Trisim1_007870 [Trichoderma cf. simile WF8]
MSEKFESILTPELIRVLGPGTKKWVVRFARMKKKRYLEDYSLLLSLLSSTLFYHHYFLRLSTFSSTIDILFDYRHSLRLSTFPSTTYQYPAKLHLLDDIARDEIIALEEEQLSESTLVEYQTEETISQNYKNVNRQHPQT